MVYRLQFSQQGKCCKTFHSQNFFTMIFAFFKRKRSGLQYFVLSTMSFQLSLSLLDEGQYLTIQFSVHLLTAPSCDIQVNFIKNVHCNNTLLKIALMSQKLEQFDDLVQNNDTRWRYLSNGNIFSFSENGSDELNIQGTLKP